MTASRSPKVLILGDDTRSFLAIVRSLGRGGISVHAAPANFRSPALTSRYISGIHYIPPWSGDGSAWSEALRTLLEREGFELVIPCDETGLLPLQAMRPSLSTLAVLAIPDDRSIAALFDKHATRELARSVGVPVSSGRLVRSDDTGATVAIEFGLPFMVKPRRSYALESLDRRGRARTIASASGFDAWLASVVSPTEFVIEKFHPGRGVGVSVLASNGRVLQAFEHRRVRENSSGGYYRASTAISTDKLHACEVICHSLEYTGVAMFEFRHEDESQRWVLLEVNARPWGSLPLAVAAGVNFPYRWYRLLLQCEESPAINYRLGIYGRSFVSDLFVILEQARQLPFHRRLVFLSARGVEFGRILIGREVEDTLVRDDPAPGLNQLGNLFRSAGTRLVRRFPGGPALARLRASHRLSRALRDNPGSARLLFVCLGNICRSPFAAAALSRCFGSRDRRLQIASAGVIPRPGRRTPAFGIAAAAERGIDLEDHRSSWLASPDASTATAIIVFDEQTETALLNRYPRLGGPVIRLGHFGREIRHEIGDPVDGDLALFRTTYAAIEEHAQALAGIVSRLRAA